MALSIPKSAVNKKCGEISAAMLEDKNEFFLNCEFCECTYLQLNQFIQHIYDDHLAQLGFFKQETATAPLFSDKAFDCYNLKSCVEENLEDNIDMVESPKEARDTNFGPNTFETVLLHQNDMEVKEECQQSIKNEEDMEHAGKKDMHNAIDVTCNEKMVPGSRIPKKEKRSFTKRLQRKKPIKQTNDIDEKKTVCEADIIPQKKTRSRKKNTQQNPVKVSDDDGTNIVEEAIDEQEHTDQEEIYSDIDNANDDEMASDWELNQKKKKSRSKKSQPTDQEEIYSANDNSNDDEMTSDYEPEQKKKKSSRKKSQTRRKSQGDTKPQAKHVRMADSIIDVSQRIILAEIHKKYTCLWDEKNDITYHFNNRRSESLKSVREEFNQKTELNLTENEFTREIMCMRKTCSNEKKQKIACKKESMEYKPSCTYYNYLEYLEDDVYPFICSICEDQHRTLGKLKEHEATHDGSSPFKCRECGRGFQVANYLTQHLRRHVHDLPFNCKVCNKAFVTATEVVIHMRTHTDDRPYVCYMCGYKLKTSSALIEHIMRHEQNRCYICDICSKGFVTPAQRREHRKIHRKERNFICDICQKGFKSKHPLKQHKLIHDAVKSYVCKICEKRFAQYTGLNIHMKSHGTTLTTSSIDKNPFFTSKP